jgi:hypothetical protein
VGQVLALAAVSALVCIVVAGCGGSKQPSVASLVPTTTTGSSSRAASSPSRAAFAECLGSHGFQAAVGSGGPGRRLSIFGVVVTGNVDPSSSQFQAAVQACRKYLPGGGPPALTPAQQAEHAKAMASFAACMRTHGIPGFPDPNGQGMFTPGALANLDPATPLVQSAYKVCARLEGSVGPRIVLG